MYSLFKLTLKTKKIIARNTLALFLTKPKRFVFEAGQFAQFSLSSEIINDERGISRAFSFASTPEERDLMIVLRFGRSAFKNCLKKMRIGDQILMDGPYGNFVLDKSALDIVFLAAGVGIVPIRSILIKVLAANCVRKLTLFYSNKYRKDAVFFDELSLLSKKHKNFLFVPTFTVDNAWQKEKGRLGKNLILKYVADIKKSKYYICGNEKMVYSLRKILSKMGISEADIHTEEFLGY